MSDALYTNHLRPSNVDEPTAEERVYELVNGELPGFFDRNPWRKIGATTSVKGPSALGFTFGDPWGPDSERVVLVWDGQILASGPHAIQEGKRAVFEVDAVRGDVLEVWATDGDVPFDLEIRPLSDRAALVEKMAAAAKDSDEGGFWSELMSTATKAQIIAAVLAGLVVVVVGPSLVKAIK